MTIQPAVKEETKKIAIGVMVLSALMVAVFLILRKFDYTVLLGALLGSGAAIGNFFLMALSVQKVASEMSPLPVEEEKTEAEGEEEGDKPLSPEAKNARKKMQLSYTLRMLMLAGIAVLAVLLPCFHSVAALLPLLFPRIVIFIIGLIQKNQREA